MKGRVMKSTGSWYSVLGEDKKLHECRIRGKLRLEGFKETNPLAVGDFVSLETENSDSVIAEILPRTNHILRQSVKKTGHSNVLAANVDQVLLIATLKQPRTSVGFIDRLLVSAEAFRIPQMIFFNKVDLLNEEELKNLESLLQLYSAFQVRVLTGSATQDADFQELKKNLSGKVTLVAGHSGVGKSTLLNRFSPDIQQPVSTISAFSEKGTHTTTFAEMFQMEDDTFIIDTPGVKEWGLVDMSQQELSDYFPEMRDIRGACKYGSRCLHQSEPKCAVREAVEEGRIAASRYNSYLSMVTGYDSRK